MKQIRTYKMTHATGFAPNYDGGVLTLATCKAGLREHAQKGEWIAGFSSKFLNGDEVGKERLVYLMEITDDILTYEEYWDKYPNKRPDKSPLGDNIFTTEVQAKRAGCNFRKINDYVIVKPARHFEDKDCSFVFGELKSNKVLISNNYRYFGKTNPLSIPDEYKIKVPIAVAKFGNIVEGDAADKFIEFVLKQENRLDIEYGKKEEQKGGCK